MTAFQSPVQLIRSAIESLSIKHAHKSLRVSLAIVFIWFGGLKLLSASPAEGLVEATAKIMIPFQFDGFIYFLGVWEVLIGVFFLSEKTKVYGIFLFFLQMIGAMSPLFVLPELCFNKFPFHLTFEGQYIVKNFVFLAAALLLITQTDKKLSTGSENV